MAILKLINRFRFWLTQRCADCGGPIGQDNGPPDGWQLEDDRTVCHACCLADFGRHIERTHRRAELVRRSERILGLTD